MAPKLYGSVVALLLLGCGSESIIDDSCFGGAVLVAAHQSVLSVGDTVRLDAHFNSRQCVPGGITTEEWRWSSNDSLIARIDSLSGLAEAVGPGNAVIEVRHAEDSEVMGSTGLTVVANARYP